VATCAWTCAAAKKIDLVDYLAGLGYHPQKASHPDYWYLSPFRDEKTVSFKVNRQKNVWYDHALGKGGDLIHFGTLYHNCSLSEFLDRLPESKPARFFLFTRLLYQATLRVPIHALLVKRKRPRTVKLLCWIPARWQLMSF
jgi:hypothetical protein